MSLPGLRLDSSRWRYSPWPLAVVPACVALLAGLGLLVDVDSKYALGGAIALFAIGLWAVDPIFPVVLTVPATLFVERLGGGGTNLSVSDFILFFGTLAALPAVRWSEATWLRRLLIVDVVYQALTVPVVIYHPTKVGIIEWFHDFFLVGGSFVVGWVLADRDRIRGALGSYLIGATALSLATMGYYAAHHFHAGGLPLRMQKNYIGDMLAFAIVAAHVNPEWARLRGRWVRWAKYICALGMLSSGSRQAIVGVLVALLVVTLRGGQLARRSKAMLLALAPLAAVAYLTVTKELASHNRFNSVHQRLSWYHQAISLWHHYVWLGAGLRFFLTGQFPLNIQPPNAEMEMLASGGIVGLVALVILGALSLRRLWSLPKAVGTLGLALVLCRLTQGQLDIFWVAAQNSLPWMLAGMSLGAADRLVRADPRAGVPAITEPGARGRGLALHGVP
ncbi:MAG: O-antigen ligase family protein [Acidimicrobiales bacterium]